MKYLLGRAFRAPDPYDQYYLDNMQIQAQGRNLKPEHAESQSILIEHRLSEPVQVSVELFQNDLNSMIEERLDAETGETRFMNVTGSRGRGAELEMRTATSSGWVARASYTTLRTEEKASGPAIVNSPRTLAKLNGQAPLPLAVHLGIELLYTGSQNSYLNTRVSSSFLTNSTLSAGFPRSGWSFSASCYNLLNMRWSTPTGPEVGEPATVQDGRTWRIRLSYRQLLPSARSRP